MPAKAMFTRKEVTEAALALVREGGLAALSSRNLASKLGSSPCPIFTVFGSMKEVEDAVRTEAKAVYRRYMEAALKKEIPFRGVGEEYVHFAYDEPELFRLIFMSGSSIGSLNTVLPTLEDSYEEVISSVMESYRLPREKAEELYGHLWIYTHGMACLTAARTCNYAPEDVERRLSDVFFSLVLNLR